MLLLICFKPPYKVPLTSGNFVKSFRIVGNLVSPYKVINKDNRCILYRLLLLPPTRTSHISIPELNIRATKMRSNGWRKLTGKRYEALS